LPRAYYLTLLIFLRVQINCIPPLFAHKHIAVPPESPVHSTSHTPRLTRTNLTILVTPMRLVKLYTPIQT